MKNSIKRSNDEKINWKNELQTTNNKVYTHPMIRDEAIESESNTYWIGHLSRKIGKQSWRTNVKSIDGKSRLKSEAIRFNDKSRRSFHSTFVCCIGSILSWIIASYQAVQSELIIWKLSCVERCECEMFASRAPSRHLAVKSDTFSGTLLLVPFHLDIPKNCHGKMKISWNVWLRKSLSKGKRLKHIPQHDVFVNTTHTLKHIWMPLKSKETLLEWSS